MATSTLASTCTGSPSLTTTNYYAGASSSPAWTANGDGTVTSYFPGVTQGNALNVTTGTTASPSCLGLTTASCSLNLTDLRGNIVGTASITSGSASVTGYSEQTEFGAPRSVATQNVVAPVYGWLGVYQKAENNLSGLVLMGVRIYNPTTGTFSSTDSVLSGNDGPYLYPADPINEYDLSGLWSIRSVFDSAGHWFSRNANSLARGVLTMASIGIICVGSLGIGCIIGVGLAAGVGFSLLGHYIFKSRGGILSAVEQGAIGGSIKVTESGAIFYGGQRFGLSVKTFLQLARALLVERE